MICRAIASLEAVNIPEAFIRHKNGLGQLTAIESDSDRQDATFLIMDGLANGQLLSFQAKNVPQAFLRHRDGRIRLEDRPQNAEDAKQFDLDATFAWEPFGSFRSYNAPNHYIRHRNGELWLDERPADADAFDEDATFSVVAPLAVD
ncbi:MAG: hypothetical protein QOJ19_1354 [Acidimicrobiia bacterium]|jgi:hypothetical protein|nr:hypothetical protein [Acidimicrobiia bacterium]